MTRWYPNEPIRETVQKKCRVCGFRYNAALEKCPKCGK